MITSNINEHNLKINDKSKETNKKNEKFLKEIQKSFNNIEKLKTNTFTFQNIKNMSLDEIENSFKNDNKIMAKNLKLSTLFSEDENLSKAIFDTILNKPLDLGFYFLRDRYDDKANFLNQKNNSLSELLHNTITNKFENKDNTNNVIDKEKLDNILLKVNSFSFLSTFSNTSKNQYDKYKDKNSNYAFLYKDYHLQYQELMHKYKNLDNYNKQMLKQF